VPSIAPSGMAYISTDTYGSDWKGSVLVGSLKFQYLERLAMDGKTVTAREKLMDGMGRVRDIAEGPDGMIYVGVEGKGIYKLVPKT
ncbi:MAG: PQQ-dependent sugar dehydrogenase, partial [Pricia sp.]